MVKGFNWTGIQDNGDGTFVTKGKREKTRLLKSLHTSGYKVRSRKNPDGSWNVTTVGYMRPSRKQPVSRGYRPQVRISRHEGQPGREGRYRPIRGRYVPIRGRYTPLRGNLRRIPMGGPSGSYPAGGFSFHPRGQGKPLSQRFADWQIQRMKDRQERIKKEQEWKNTEQEINEKMKQDRLSQEEIEKEQLRQKVDQEIAQAKHQKAQELKQIRHTEFQSRIAAQKAERQRAYEETQRRTTQVTSQGTPFRRYESYPEQERQRVYEESSRQAAKVDRSKLQEARESSVTGE